MASIDESEGGRKRDLIHLTGPLTQEAILRQLHQNFIEGRCYTWIGPILLCINAYENPSPSMMAELRRMGKNLTEELYQLRRTRTLVFSGKSGSGKTFTAERLIVKMFSDSVKSEWLQDIRKYWQVSSVVLKALGSAGTQANKDSSRIGRLVEFHYQDMQITRLKVNCYFLDQTRLVSAPQYEQNYHIFYQILAGLTPEERGKFHFPHYDSRTLHYLSQAADPPDSPQQLQNHFEAWKSSLAQLGIPLNDVLKVLIAILLLGNVLFYEAKNQELSLQGTEEIKSVASLLGVSPQSLQRGLTMRTYHSQHGPVQSTCSAAGANSARDSLAKALYIRTMVAVMRRINSLLKGVAGQSPTKPQARKTSLTKRDSNQISENVISIVDLHGFEKNESNSLEQLCVNWTAEKLKHHYTQTVFHDTLKACQIEGVDPLFESMVHDCAPVIQLIGNNHSELLKEINQETIAPRVSAGDIRVRMRNKLSSYECFIPPAGSSSTFVIKHYCGDVVYDTYNILNANADTLADDIVSVFSAKECKFGFVAHLFATETSKELLPDGSPRGQMCRITPSSLQHSSQLEARQPSSFVQDFQAHMEDIANVLKKAQPYFVLCIKANNTQTPGQFDREAVAEQIREMSIFETVDLIQGGYYHNMLYKDFVKRYQAIAPGALERLRSRAYEMTEDLLSAFIRILEEYEITDDMWAHGQTKIFLTEELRQHLERLLGEVRERAAIKVQSVVRMYLAQKQWPRRRFEMQQQQMRPQVLSPSDSDHSSPPPVPERQRNGNASSQVGPRNYTIVGGYKITFPQWRVMRCNYPDTSRAFLHVGDEVHVVGRSQKRGYLIVEHLGKQIHMPHYYTELILTPPSYQSGPGSIPTRPTLSPSHPQSSFSEL